MSPLILLLTLISWEVKKKKKVHTQSDSFSLSIEGLTPLVLETLPAPWEITCIIIGGEVGRAGSRLKDTPPSSPPSLGLLLPSTSQKCADFLTACILPPQKRHPCFLLSPSLFGKFSSMSILFNTFFFFFFLMKAVIFKPHNWNLCCQRYFFLNK